MGTQQFPRLGHRCVLQGAKPSETFVCQFGVYVYFGQDEILDKVMVSTLKSLMDLSHARLIWHVDPQ